MAEKVYKDIGIRPYYKTEGECVLRQKITVVSKRFFKDKSMMSTEELKEEEGYKADRKTRRPKYGVKDKKDDIEKEEWVFPTKFRWVGCLTYDTHFASSGIALSELETARERGEKARKKMFKLTSAGKFKEKTIASAFEVFTWAASADKECKLKELELKLEDKEPWLCGKEIEKVKFGSDAEEFRKHLLEWL
jgi:hypothetical protein